MTVSLEQLHAIVRGPKGATKTEWVPTKSTSPGEVITYVLHYANAGDAPATDAVIEDPIPQGTTYVAGSAAGAGAQLTFSTDGGKTFVPASAIEGRAAAVTHVRWTLARVAPGQSGQVSLRVQIRR